METRDSLKLMGQLVCQVVWTTEDPISKQVEDEDQREVVLQLPQVQGMHAPILSHTSYNPHEIPSHPTLPRKQLSRKKKY